MVKRTPAARPYRPGELVYVHWGREVLYPLMAGRYGIVQDEDETGAAVGVEWDASPAYGISGHNLGGLLPPPRHRAGWYVPACDLARV